MSAPIFTAEDGKQLQIAGSPGYYVLRIRDDAKDEWRELAGLVYEGQADDLPKNPHGLRPVSPGLAKIIGGLS